MAVLLVLQLLPNGNRRCIATSMIQQLHPVVMEAAMMRTRTDLKTGVAMECIMGGNDTCIWGLELSFLGLGFCSPVHLPCLVFRTVTSLPPAVLPRMACNLRDCACRFDIMESVGMLIFLSNPSVFACQPLDTKSHAGARWCEKTWPFFTAHDVT